LCESGSQEAEKAGQQAEDGDLENAMSQLGSDDVFELGQQAATSSGGVEKEQHVWIDLRDDKLIDVEKLAQTTHRQVTANRTVAKLEAAGMILHNVAVHL
jgi:hypothetical protein